MNKPLCARHKDKQERPLGCATCNRISLEQMVVRKVVRALLEAGWALQTDDGESLRPEDPARSANAILPELMETDEERLVATRGEEELWVRFVYGNDGWDVINDYSVGLEPIVGPVEDWAMEQGG